MIKHYMTKYSTDDGRQIIESWLQFNIFNWTIPFSRKRYVYNRETDVHNGTYEEGNVVE